MLQVCLSLHPPFELELARQERLLRARVLVVVLLLGLVSQLLQLGILVREFLVVLELLLEVVVGVG